MTLLLTFKTTVRGCARCGGDHIDLEFAPLDNGEDLKASHWALCPANGQPIMLLVAKARGRNFKRFTPSITPAFDRFWDAYPKKKSKPHAMNSFTTEMAHLIEPILAAIKWQKTTPEWTKEGGQYIPYPATWLRGRRWEDQPMKTIGYPKPDFRAPTDDQLRTRK